MSTKDFIEHIEFFGYNAELDEDVDWVLTGGASAPENLTVTERANGLNFRAAFDLENSTFDEISANAVNSKLWLSKVTIFSDKKLVVIEAWTPMVYSKAGFGTFFDRFKRETQIFLDELIGSLIEEE